MLFKRDLKMNWTPMGSAMLLQLLFLSTRALKDKRAVVDKRDFL